MTHEIRFGVCLEVFDEWVKLAELGDKVGLQDIWLRADMAYQDSFSDITFALTETERARFFPYANSVFLRHPVLLASGIANMDRLRPGRVGAAYCSAGFETSVGLHIPDEDSVQACREAIEITRLLWTGESITYKGRHWELTDVRLQYQARSGIPIWLATRGKKFKLAGELADGIITHGKAGRFLKQMGRHLEEGSKVSGRDHRKIERAIVLPLLITGPEDKERARRSLRGMLGAFVGGEYSLDWLDTFGISIEEVRPLREYIRLKGFSPGIGELVSDNLLSRLIEGYAVVGTPEECINEIEEMRRGGATVVVPLIIKSWFPEASDARRYMQTYAEKIVQSFGEQ